MWDSEDEMDPVLDSKDVYTDDDGGGGDGPFEDPKWFHKVEYLIDHTLNVSQKHCCFPGWNVSIDEMMRKFKGRSLEMVRINNKPIKEGFNFFSLSDTSTGYVYSFIPSGRTDKVKISNMVVALGKELPDRLNKKYMITMDNYFTVPDAITGMRDEGIGMVGTSRSRRSWPPESIRSIDDDIFNTLYYLNDPNNYRIFIWVDNNVVTMVSNVHTGKEKISRVRCHPRLNIVNRANVQKIWVDKG